MLERWDGGREPASRSQVDSIYMRRGGGEAKGGWSEGRGHNERERRKRRQSHTNSSCSDPTLLPLLMHLLSPSVPPSLPLGRAVRPCPQRREERKAESSMRHLGASHVFTHRFCLPTKIDLDTCGVVSRLTLLTPWHGVVSEAYDLN